MTSANAGTAIMLRSGDVDAWRFAVDLAGAGVASNDHVALVLFDASLATMLKAGFELNPIAVDLSLVRALGRATKSFQFLACSGAVERSGADPDLLIDSGRLDDVCGLPAIWRFTASMRIIVI